MPRQQAPHPGEVADRAVGEDQMGTGMALGQLQGVAAEGRDATAGVDQDREPALVGEGDQVADRRLAHRELLGAGVELDPAGACVEAAPRLGEGAAAGIDPAEGDQSATGPGRGRHRLVVGGAVAVRLVHREGHRPGAGPLHRPQQLGRLLLVAVGVIAAEVGVRVEEGKRPGLAFDRLQPPPRLDLDRLLRHGRPPWRFGGPPLRQAPARCRC
jgi:hypothetical protein